ncbi:MAG: 3-deoxy-D-manno-octulosonic acid transferase [Candidatus Omnitrophica bacterium]|nr:3-deoxy-D-manno-octulosonic acid transferase [Candidatus Omnitrophota bacterium]
MRFFFDTVYLLLALVYLPLLILRRKLHRGFVMRLGFLKKSVSTETAAARPVWIHAVSVGEAMVARRFLEEFRPKLPGKRFVFSTVTATGNAIAKGMAEREDTVIYAPLDLSLIVEKAVSRIKPGLFICVETEIWPNLIACLRRKGIPVAVINARISDASFGGYRLFKFLFGRTFASLSLACAQTDLDRRRLAQLGVPEERIVVTGNMKFDFAARANPAASQILTASAQELLWVCGSTHPGEEEVLTRVYKNVSARFPQLKLLIAPRHPERTPLVSQLLARHGFNPRRISQLTQGEVRLAGSNEVYILDTVGELFSYYRQAAFVFIGGSLVKHGGQNLLEPASLAKPVIFGPHMFNFRRIAELFLQNNAALMIRDAEDLEQKVTLLLTDIALREKLGQRAQKVMRENQGATKETAARITELCGNYERKNTKD